jgi:response regulator RpfG family c-di-GMP phosphodiesterase/signal transduction histidine kinase
MEKKSLRQLFFGEELDIQQRQLNLILIVAILFGFVSLCLSAFVGLSVQGVIVVLLTIFVAGLSLWLSVKKGNTLAAALIITTTANVILFPIMYFSNGGLHSGMPLWLVLGLIFSWLILQGKICYVMYFINILVASGCILLEQWHPEFVNEIDGGMIEAFDVIQSLIIISCIIGIIFKFQTYLYVKQQRIMAKQDEKLLETLDELNRADRAKSDFLANISHEIRTPINAVLGMDEMILRENQQSNIDQYARNIESAGQTLLALINDILDFSKIESGKMEIIPDKYDLFELLKDSYNMISMRARDKNLKLEVKNDETIPFRLYGDEIRVRQITFNLLTNAVKYTKEGKVTLLVNWERKSKEEMVLKIAVKDTGIGITEENQERLFESFERIEERKNRHIEGTGLGLSITKQLLDLMGGTMSVESEYGAGSTFSVEIPQKVLSEVPMGNFYERYESSAHKVKKEKKKDRLEAPDARVLVVDDMPMNLDVAVALLKRTKIHVERASSGEECLRKVAKKKYHVILLDHMMPEMDGVETLRRMRQLEDYPNVDTPVIAMTANAVIGAKEEYLSQGFQDYLSKPVKGEDLEAMVWKHMPKKLIHRSSQAQKKNEKTELTDDGLLNALSFLDTATGIMYCGDSVEFYREILMSYVGNSNLTEELKKSFDDGNWKDYQVQVHALKSSSLSIGALELSEKAKQLEMAARNEDIAYIEENHAEVMGDYRSLLERLRQILSVEAVEGADEQLKENRHILIIDEDSISLEMTKKALESQFRVSCSTQCREGLETVRNDVPDLLIFDMQTEEMEGSEVIHMLRNDDTFRDMPVVFVSSDMSKETEVRAFKEGAMDYITKPIEPEILIQRVSRILDLRYLQENLENEVERQTTKARTRRQKVERLSRQILQTLAATIDAKDKYTTGHSRRVAEYARTIAERAGMSKKDQECVYYMGMLHDIGVIGVPDDIINRVDFSSEDEEIMRKHATIGADILQSIVEMPELQIGAKYHHEWYDGSGYPEGLKGEEIPELARIVAMADTYDAMTSNRLYRDVLSQSEVKREIEEGMGTQFDPKFARIMLDMISEDKDYKMRGTP